MHGLTNLKLDIYILIRSDEIVIETLNRKRAILFS